MRTFRLIETALLAILVCVNFIACSSDTPEPEKNEEGVVTNQKKLVEIIIPEEETIQKEYFYDDEGRLTKATHRDGSTYIYYWDTNTIIEDTRLWQETFSLKNNLIISSKEIWNSSPWGDSSVSEDVFNYDAKGLLQSIDYYYNTDFRESCKIVWEGSKIMQIGDTKFTYSGKTCKGYLPILIWYFDESCSLFEAHPELIGVRTNQLPDEDFDSYSRTSEYYDEIIGEVCKVQYISESKTKFAYTFDDDGYVKSCTRTEIDTDITIYSFKDLNGDGVITDDERNVENLNNNVGSNTRIFKWE